MQKKNVLIFYYQDVVVLVDAEDMCLCSGTEVIVNTFCRNQQFVA